MNVTANIPEIDMYLGRLGTQLRFGVSLALNRTAKDVQDDERIAIRQRFQLRRADFIERTVKISTADYSTKDKLNVTVGIDPTRDLLSKFQDGGFKTPQQAPALAIPTAALVGPSRAGIVPASKRIRALNFTPTLVQRGGRPLMKGLQRTFLIPGLGVFQRVSSSGARGLEAQLDAGDIVMLYKFKPKVQLRAQLGFYETALATIERVWEKRFYEALDYAIATAR